MADIACWPVAVAGGVLGRRSVALLMRSVPTPTLSGQLVDGSGVATASISASGYTVLNISLKDPGGLPIPNQVIDVSGDVSKVIFPEGNAGLTNSSGVASIKIARASLTASGAGSLTAAFSYKVGSIAKYPNGSPPPSADKVFSTYVGYELSAANISLTNMNVGASTLPAYGTRQVSVQANINGAVSATPVQVNFSATCGQVSPATASTNSAGVAVVSYTATDVAGAASTLGCSGKTVEISASTLGASVLSKSLTVLAAPATNISFVSVTSLDHFLGKFWWSNPSDCRFQTGQRAGRSFVWAGHCGDAENADLWRA